MQPCARQVYMAPFDFGLGRGSGGRGGGGAAARKQQIDSLFERVTFAERWPYADADFDRQDTSSDALFYEQPRLVRHIDDAAIRALTEYYAATLRDGMAVLDLCSSWVSHYPRAFRPRRAVGLGMNAEELRRNSQLTEYVVRDLNDSSSSSSIGSGARDGGANGAAFPFDDASFDCVTCAVSVDYLARPLAVFREIRRVLRPGGTCVIAQSNRVFPSKAVAIWLSTSDAEHVYIIGSYFHYAGGFRDLRARDITPRGGIGGIGGGGGDPMFIVQAEKA